jgi:hypothetical protein
MLKHIIQAAYIIRTFFFCLEAQRYELVNSSWAVLLSHSLLTLRTKAIVPEESFCYLTIQTQDVTETTREVRKKKRKIRSVKDSLLRLFFFLLLLSSSSLFCCKTETDY